MYKLPIFLCSLSILTACATHQSRLSPAQRDLLSGNCTLATKTLSDLSEKSSDDKLLYLMEYGSALQICKDFRTSNKIFLEADKLSENLDYVSASRVLGATLLNEEMLQYKGDIFERLFINISLALNYLELNQPDEAMVEVRRINEKYNKFASEEKNSYELNSFAQYLSGLIFETQNRHDDACISYKAAYKLDSSYRDVGLDMLSSCWRAKRLQEFKIMSAEINPSSDELSYIKRKVKNEKIVLFLQGLGPKKMPRPDNHLYPYLVPSHNLIKKLRLALQFENGDYNTAESYRVYSVEKAAIATQEADYKSLAARRLGARIAKEVAADQIRQKDKTLGNIAWLVMVASERADLRNWSLLPESVQVVRVNPMPKTILKVAGISTLDSQVENFPDIDLAADENKKIYLIRSIK